MVTLLGLQVIELYLHQHIIHHRLYVKLWCVRYMLAQHLEVHSVVHPPPVHHHSLGDVNMSIIKAGNGNDNNIVVRLTVLDLSNPLVHKCYPLSTTRKGEGIGVIIAQPGPKFDQ